MHLRRDRAIFLAQLLRWSRDVKSSEAFLAVRLRERSGASTWQTDLVRMSLSDWPKVMNSRSPGGRVERPQPTCRVGVAHRGKPRQVRITPGLSARKMGTGTRPTGAGPRTRCVPSGPGASPHFPGPRAKQAFSLLIGGLRRAKLGLFPKPPQGGLLDPGRRFVTLVRL